MFLAMQLAGQWSAFEGALQVAVSDNKEIARKLQPEWWKAVLEPLSKTLMPPALERVLLIFSRPKVACILWSTIDFLAQQKYQLAVLLCAADTGHRIHFQVVIFSRQDCVS